MIVLFLVYKCFGTSKAIQENEPVVLSDEQERHLRARAYAMRMGLTHEKPTF